MEQRAKTTTDHERIRNWAERRGGEPATVILTAKSGEPGLLRIDFPGFSGKGSLKKIPWEAWFEKFDQSGLQFLYQDKTKDGKESRFFKLVNKAPARRATSRRLATSTRSSASRRTTRRSAPASAARGRGNKRARSRSAQR